MEEIINAYGTCDLDVEQNVEKKVQIVEKEEQKVQKVEIDKKKEYIFAFIKNTFDTYSFERMEGFNEETEKKCFKKCVDNLSDEDVICYFHLCKKFKKSIDVINIVDEENFIEFRAYSIYFNKKGELCIMSPR